MAQALRLAARGRYSTTPNPRVGCVLVQQQQVIGEGWHVQAGGPHAEVDAIAKATAPVAGTTAYVSLEPCSHQGRTPPCADALVQAGVGRVVIAMEDPNPAVSGRGIERLRNAGIEVQCGVLKAEARQLNRGFVQRMQSGRPFVFAKLASSLDGRTAMASGESQWITGAAARREVQRMRAASCAVITGIGTVLADDPALTVREPTLAADYPLAEFRQPLRVVVDPGLRLSAGARLLQPPGEAVIVTLQSSLSRAVEFERAGVSVVAMPERDGRIDLAALLRWLAEERACNEVMVESGPVLSGALLQAGLLDELHLFMAPTLLGSSARPLLELPLQEMAQQQRMQVEEMRAIGEDWWWRLLPQSSS